MVENAEKKQPAEYSNLHNSISKLE